MTYFGVFNFGTSYLGATIGQNKTMTKISRFTVPSDWKHAPAYKKGEKYNAANYRPISLSLVSVVKLWNMSLQNTYLTIWKATVYYMIFNMDSDILDPVKPNYCPLFKNLLQIQIKKYSNRSHYHGLCQSL